MKAISQLPNPFYQDITKTSQVQVQVSIDKEIPI